MQRSELQLIAAALRKRWDIPEEYRDAMVRRIVKIIADPASKNRDVIAASRVLVAAEGQNQTDERLESELMNLRERFIEAATAVGLGNPARRLAND